MQTDLWGCSRCRHVAHERVPWPEACAEVARCGKDAVRGMPYSDGSVGSSRQREGG